MEVFVKIILELLAAKTKRTWNSLLLFSTSLLELVTATPNLSPNQPITGNEPAESGFFYARNRDYFTAASWPFDPLKNIRRPFGARLAAW